MILSAAYMATQGQLCFPAPALTHSGVAPLEVGHMEGFGHMLKSKQTKHCKDC